MILVGRHPLQSFPTLGLRASPPAHPSSLSAKWDVICPPRRRSCCRYRATISTVAHPGYRPDADVHVLLLLPHVIIVVVSTSARASTSPMTSQCRPSSLAAQRGATIVHPKDRGDCSSPFHTICRRVSIPSPPSFFPHLHPSRERRCPTRAGRIIRFGRRAHAFPSEGRGNTKGDAPS